MIIKGMCWKENKHLIVIFFKYIMGHVYHNYALQIKQNHMFESLGCHVRVSRKASKSISPCMFHVNPNCSFKVSQVNPAVHRGSIEVIMRSLMIE